MKPIGTNKGEGGTKEIKDVISNLNILHSLIASIRQRRKDLFVDYSHNSCPIDPTPPAGFFKGKRGSETDASV